jgi:hypothetical protein
MDGQVVTERNLSLSPLLFSAEQENDNDNPLPAKREVRHFLKVSF